jgi:hypothetical protein
MKSYTSVAIWKKNVAYSGKDRTNISWIKTSADFN